MRKVTKFMIALSTIVAAAGVSSYVLNNKMKERNDEIVENAALENTKNEQEKEKEYNEIVKNIPSFERQVEINNTELGTKYITSSCDFLKTRTNIFDMDINNLSQNHHNLEENKHLYVSINKGYTEHEKQLIKECVEYFNYIVSTINPEFSIEYTDEKIELLTCLDFVTRDRFTSGYIEVGPQISALKTYAKMEPNFRAMEAKIYTHKIESRVGKDENLYDSYFKFGVLREMAKFAGFTVTKNDDIINHVLSTEWLVDKTDF